MYKVTSLQGSSAQVEFTLDDPRGLYFEAELICSARGFEPVPMLKSETGFSKSVIVDPAVPVLYLFKVVPYPFADVRSFAARFIVDPDVPYTVYRTLDNIPGMPLDAGAYNIVPFPGQVARSIVDNQKLGPDDGDMLR